LAKRDFREFSNLYDARHMRNFSQRDSMAKDIKATVDIRLISSTQTLQTARLLSRTFNVSAKDMRKTLDAAIRGKSKRATAVFVATKGRKVVGSVMAECSDDVCLISRLAVAPDERKQGLGKALMRCVEEHIQEAMLHGNGGTIMLGDATKTGNPKSSFYEKLGYAPENPPRHVSGHPVLVKTVVALPRSK
jgi:predicted N-acetyltransferase YhbS